LGEIRRTEWCHGMNCELRRWRTVHGARFIGSEEQEGSERLNQPQTDADYRRQNRRGLTFFTTEAQRAQRRNGSRRTGQTRIG
jgi:hypothetical protein